MELSVREMNKGDIPLVVDYFHNSEYDFLYNMGCQPEKLPKRDAWINLLEAQRGLTYEEKEFFYLIWLQDDIPLGHCNINKIKFAEEAYMHLHMWPSNQRKKGIGTKFLRLALPHFFKNYQLQNLYCEPFAHNPPPNNTLPKLGFEFIKCYETTPGWINYKQEVNRYVLKRDSVIQNADIQ